jgi:hypothetical protein
MRAAALVLALAMLALPQSGASPVPQNPAPPAVYSTDPADPWNRVFALLFTRRGRFAAGLARVRQADSQAAQRGATPAVAPSARSGVTASHPALVTETLAVKKEGRDDFKRLIEASGLRR